jgi:hypothetical protein
MKQPYTLFIFVLFVSCSSKISYVGSKNEPTRKIDVYVDGNAIKHSYDIVGKGYADRFNLGFQHQDKLMKAAIKKAKANGADAVWFREYYIYSDGTYINGTTRVDTIYRGVTYSSNSRVLNNPATLVRDILFIKYK